MTARSTRSAEPPEKDAIAGLARHAEDIRRRLVITEGQLKDVTKQVAELGDRMNTAAPPPSGPTSWLNFPRAADDKTAAARAGTVLSDLTEWLAAVFLRFPDGRQCLPECWLWHCDVVEELLWLRQGWSAAYRGRSASVMLAGDWHDRLRPGAVRRIRVSAGTCSYENHRLDPSSVRLTARSSAQDAVRVIASWWTAARDEFPPGPESLGGSEIAPAVRA